MKCKTILLAAALGFSQLACNSNQANNTSTSKEIDPVEGATNTGTTEQETVPPVKTGNNTKTSGEAYKITQSQVGPVKTGMPITEFLKVMPANQVKVVKINQEGQEYRAYEVWPKNGSGEKALLVEEICKPTCVVWRMEVRNPAYKTKEEIGVGSTLGEVKKHYPISFLGFGETEIVAVSADKKITFLLDVSKLPEKMVPRLNVNNIPDSVRVKGMLIL